jgi:hypothetical protein
MADLRKQMQMQLGQAERKLLSDEVLYDASVAYFNWKNFEEFQMYAEYNTNAETRFYTIHHIKQARIKEPSIALKLALAWKESKTES